MATSNTNDTSAFVMNNSTFESSSDAELQVAINDIETNYLPFVNAFAKPDLVKVIEMMKAFQKKKDAGHRLHLAISTERVSVRPAVSIKVQWYQRDVQAHKHTSMFVKNGTNPNP